MGADNERERERERERRADRQTETHREIYTISVFAWRGIKIKREVRTAVSRFGLAVRR